MAVQPKTGAAPSLLSSWRLRLEQDHRKDRGSEVEDQGKQRSSCSKHLKGDLAEERLETLGRNDWPHVSSGADKVPQRNTIGRYFRLHSLSKRPDS